MVFGWGKKKEKESIEEISTQKNIHLTEVAKITEDLLNLRKTQTLAEIKSLRKLVLPRIKELAEIIRELEKDDLNVDDIDKHLRIIVVRGKRQVIDVIKKEATNLPDVSSIEDVSDLSNTLNQKLKKIGDVLGRQTRVIHIFAKKYAEKLKEILEEMNSHNKEIAVLLKNWEDTKSHSEEIETILKEISNMNSETILKTTQLLEFQNSLDSIQENLQTCQNSIDKIKNEPKYMEFLKLNNSFDDFKETKNLIKNQIDSQFTKISRPLGRYEYVSSLDKEQKSLLSALINNPIDAINAKNKDSIVIILENVRKGISSGSVSVKDVEKSQNYLTETEELLDSFINKIQEFEEKKQAFQNNLKSFDNSKLLELQGDLEKSIEEKTSLESKITSHKKEIEANDKNLPEKISQIEKKIQRFSNTDYTISRSS
jgi:hypothetical protein